MPAEILSLSELNYIASVSGVAGCIVELIKSERTVLYKGVDSILVVEILCLLALTVSSVCAHVTDGALTVGMDDNVVSLGLFDSYEEANDNAIIQASVTLPNECVKAYQINKVYINIPVWTSLSNT